MRGLRFGIVLAGVCRGVFALLEVIEWLTRFWLVFSIMDLAVPLIVHKFAIAHITQVSVPRIGAT